MIYGACPIFIQHIQQMQRSAEHTERYLERVIYIYIYVYIYTYAHVYWSCYQRHTKSMEHDPT